MIVVGDSGGRDSVTGNGVSSGGGVNVQGIIK